jgi:FtsH-binding integral membrane protein
MNRMHVIRNAVVVLLAKGLVVTVVVVALCGVAAPLAVDRHDNALLAIAIGCFFAALVAAVVGVAWIADSVSKLRKKLEVDS